MLDVRLPFAADAVPWYQDYQFWAFIGLIVGGIWGFTHFLFRERLRRANQERDELRQNLLDAEARREDPSAVQDLTRELTESERGRNTAEAEAARLQRFVDSLNQNLRVAGKMAGLTWRANVREDAPALVPLGQRRTPIIAVLNLKGGVGKTTLTANLGAAFARQDWRVLLIDLDLQASLTSLFVSAEQLDRASRQRRLIQHYFEQAAAGSDPRFADFLLPTGERNLELAGSSDALAYAETNLTVRWFLQPGRGDVRLLLREALHTAAMDRFDAILIDCPPVLNVSCVNALATADFVLVPVMPSRGATDRVGPMLVHLRALRRAVNPELTLLGVVANRTHRAGSLTHDEQNLWNALRTDCHTEWGSEVAMCATAIPQSTEIRTAEASRRPLRPTDDTFAAFQQLAAELAPRFPPHRSRSALTGAAS